MDNLLKRIPQAYKTGAVFLVWGVFIALILQRTPYGIEEGAARALLLVWSAVDHVISPVITLGVPDFRALFFIPAGILWTGQIMPAKVFAVAFMAAAGWSMYTWRRDAGEAESALLATGVLLISPLILSQLDALGVAPYLLCLFAFGAWMDRNYRQQPQVAFGGWYFAQMVVCFVATALHPAGLGYAATLASKWYQEKSDVRRRKQFLAGIAVSVLCALLLTFGWRNAEWLANPFVSLSALLEMPAIADSSQWFTSSIVALALIWVVARKFTALRLDFLGSSLLFGLIAGVFAADHAWAVLAFTIILYWGFSWLLSVTVPGLSGFIGQRGVAFIVLFALCVSFLSIDRSRYETSREGVVTAHDALIESFVQETNATTNTNAGIATERAAAIKVASQWPGQTMLACRCDAYPLPPDVADEQTLLKMLHGIDYLMFDPQNKHNESLVRNLAMLGGEYTEVISVQTSGVIVQIKAMPALDADKNSQRSQPNHQ